jgi:hypothetical protein
MDLREKERREGRRRKERKMRERERERKDDHATAAMGSNRRWDKLAIDEQEGMQVEIVAVTTNNVGEVVTVIKR